MNKLILKWTVAIVAVAGFVAIAIRETPATPEGVWLTDYPAALRTAKSEKKPVLIDLQAEWCGPCHMMTDDVFKKPTFRAQSGRWVLLKIDVDQQPDVAAKFGSNSLPTLVVLNADGKPVVGTQGYRDPATTMNFLERAFQKATSPAGSASQPTN